MAGGLLLKLNRPCLDQTFFCYHRVSPQWFILWTAKLCAEVKPPRLDFQGWLPKFNPPNVIVRGGIALHNCMQCHPSCNFCGLWLLAYLRNTKRKRSKATRSSTQTVEPRRLELTIIMHESRYQTSSFDSFSNDLPTQASKNYTTTK